ncbi:MAG: hypothetical protein E7372_05780 [Clostridiales bacterium]|nr:hypothetical protein [Clostridiales bacterium]
MTKKNTIIKSLLLTFLLIMMCSSCFMLTACKDEPTVYKLYQYETSGSVYELGDSFYGMKLKKDFVKLTLNEDGNAELKISVGFIEGEVDYVNNYTTYKGSYSETATEIVATFPEFSSSALHGTKTGNLISIRLSSYITLILKK